jgi:diacylglycerol kinase family enzyme
MLRGRDPGKSRWAIGFTCTELALHSEDDFPIQADGDIVGAGRVDLAIRAAPLHFR